MTDRELLEKAAKAEGHGVFFDDLSGLTWWYEDDDVASAKYVCLLWDPLHNDGDALRLAVKLGLSIHTDDFDHLSLPRMPGMAIAQHTSKDISEGCDWVDDPYAATRRAIVRAAAAIGEKT